MALLGTAQGGRHGIYPKCAVIHGNEMSQTAPLAWARMKKLHDEGKVKIILIDPRKTKMGDDADLWLRIRPGTDTALLLGWINIIIKEELYDKEFVENWTYGFEELKARAAEYTPEKVSEITWVPKDLIIESARMYAANFPAELKDASSTDMLGRNAIRVEQARVCLRALTGNLKVRVRGDGGGSGTDHRRQVRHPRFDAADDGGAAPGAAQKADRLGQVQAYDVAGLRADGAEIRRDIRDAVPAERA